MCHVWHIRVEVSSQGIEAVQQLTGWKVFGANLTLVASGPRQWHASDKRSWAVDEPCVWWR